MIDQARTQYGQDPVELDLHAYNAAFYQLGLRWHWDRERYDQLLEAGGTPVERVRRYLQDHQAHLLTAYDADFLATAIETAKVGCRKALHAAPASGYFNWSEIHAAELGV